MDRFWNNVDKTGSCWIWKGSKRTSGYGAFHLNGKTENAHRAAWMIYTASDIPKDNYVLHKCDVRACVNPVHLYLGTISQNNHDTYDRKRRRPVCFRGPINPNSRLSRCEVRRIIKYRKRLAFTTNHLSQFFGVSRRQIKRILDGTHWGCKDK